MRFIDYYLPEDILDNYDLEKTFPEFTAKKLGIKSE
jgi:hypothetical protein